MTVLPVYGGPIKRDLIDRAYGMCGQSSTEYELSPEEYVVGLRALNDSVPTSSGYYFPTYGDGSPQDESGLDNADVLGVCVLAARLIAPQIGKQLNVSKTQARAADKVIAKYQTTPNMDFGRGTIRGSGSRYWSPFFSVTD